MHADPVVKATCLRLERDHSAHTILLYGSRDNGTDTPDSDYDIAAFAPVSRLHRVTDLVGASYLDVFVYPDTTLQESTDELLRLRGSKVLLQRGHEADSFLERLESRFAAGPSRLCGSEAQARRDWLVKMAARSRRGDVEGDFRRVWLLTAALEDYFSLRHMWYEGPKKALAWLSLNDPIAHGLFSKALTPGADLEAIGILVRHVISYA